MESNRDNGNLSSTGTVFPSRSSDFLDSQCSGSVDGNYGGACSSFMHAVVKCVVRPDCSRLCTVEDRSGSLETKDASRTDQMYVRWRFSALSSCRLIRRAGLVKKMPSAVSDQLYI